MLKIARQHLRQIDAGLQNAPLHMRMLDGPPGSPRYAISVAECQRAGPCPYHVADEAHCPVLECSLRHSLRLLLTREGELVEVIQGDIRWE